jgi:mRNA-degrading endonuclease HigB of HigAB toxin-antitoxin module
MSLQAIVVGLKISMYIHKTFPNIRMAEYEIDEDNIIFALHEQRIDTEWAQQVTKDMKNYFNLNASFKNDKGYVFTITKHVID